MLTSVAVMPISVNAVIFVVVTLSIVISPALSNFKVDAAPFDLIVFIPLSTPLRVRPPVAVCASRIKYPEALGFLRFVSGFPVVNEL